MSNINQPANQQSHSTHGTEDSIKELYQEVILEHNRSPKNFKVLDNPTHSCDGYNPLCGDQITVYVKADTVDGQEVIADLSFNAQSCAICKASCSIMTETVKGKTINEFKEIFERFHNMAIGKPHNGELGKLEIFSNISRYPTRVKCATLGWHTLKDALSGKGKSSTE